jgi:hypothetical protein
MASATEKIESQIFELPLDDLLLLHERLVATIHDKAEREGLDPEYRRQILARIDDIDSGRVPGVDAFDALKNM